MYISYFQQSAVLDGTFDLYSGDALVDDGLHEGFHLLGAEFLQPLHGGGAVDGVDHPLARTQLADDIHQRQDDFGAGGVEVGRAQHAGLQYEVALETFQGFDDTRHVVARGGQVDFGNEVVGGGVDFHDGVVHAAQGVEDLGQVDAGGVAQHGDLGPGVVPVAQAEGVVDDLGELGVERRLAVAAEGDAVYGGALVRKPLQHPLEVGAHLHGGGQEGVVAAVAVPAALAVDAVEVADLALLGQEVDAQ